MTDKKLTLDDWLAKIYQANIRNKSAAAIVEFKTALVDADFMAEAQTRLVSLDEMIATRGEQACAYSTKYRNFLKEALA